jgi:hypothetical protein
MIRKINYEFSGEIWRYNGTGGWFFITMPVDLSKEIRDMLQWQEEGWGRLKVSAIINTLEWKTSIWFDTKLNTYLLPIKAEIRKKANLENGTIVTVSILV